MLRQLTTFARLYRMLHQYSSFIQLFRMLRQLTSFARLYRMLRQYTSFSCLYRMLRQYTTFTRYMFPWRQLDYKNLSPVTGADGIFRSRRGLFTQYRGPDLTSVNVFKDKIEQMGLIFAHMNALYFYNSVWIYAFIHKCWLQNSFINFPWRH